MKDVIFKTLLLIRVVFPPLMFSLFHPFIAMLVNEVLLDGLISPHHLFTKFIPENVKGKHKMSYDIFLDSWGFLMSLIPVFYKNGKYYHVFDGYRTIVSFLFVWKIVCMSLVYKFKDYRPSFPAMLFLPVYLSIGFCDFFKVETNKGRVMALFIIVFAVRELWLQMLNKKL